MQIKDVDFERLAKLASILSKVKFVDDCWIYPSKARGQARMDGKLVYVYRLVYELWFGKKVKDEAMRHLCYEKKCVNPYHLEPGTGVENARDKIFPPVIAMVERLRELGYHVEKS